MTTEPYASARRVFWVVDNGTIHRGQNADRPARRAVAHPVLVHLPVHASWLNQIEIYFSILARKALTPCHFASLAELADRVIGFQPHSDDRQARLTGPSPAATSRPLDRLGHAAGSRRPPERTCVSRY